jgi:hypothetical protein
MARPTAPLPLALLAVTFACDARDPPAPDASPFTALPEVPAAFAAASESPDASPRRTLGTAVGAVEAGAEGGADAAVDPALLPQTRDKPSASSAAFEARAAALWDAIATGDADRAMHVFFPLGAYLQVKDVADPAADWKRRLVAAFARDIRALHARLGKGPEAESAKFRGLDVPEARAKWVNPGEEYNKLGYFRVFGSKLRYEVGGEERSFEVKSLISWRGEWYVVHLSAIK